MSFTSCRPVPVHFKATLGSTAYAAQIAAAVESAGAKTDQQIKTMLQQKAEEVVSKLDLQKALSLDIPPEQIVQDAMQQATAQLQSKGGSLHLAAPVQQTSDSPVQVRDHLAHA